MRARLFALTRSLWLGLNAACFLVAAWYATLPPVEGTHPGFLLAPIWLVLLFPGNIAMAVALALLNALAPPWVFARLGTLLLFGIWAGGGVLSFAFWFVWLPRWLSRRKQPSRLERTPA